jgi:hypothetical protein
MKRMWIAGVVALAVATPAAAQIGGILDKASKAAQVGKKIIDLNISEDEERQIGAAVSEKVRQRYGVVQDPAVHRYVTLVGTLVTRASTRPGVAWQFIVLDTDGVNAFAAPGGGLTKAAINKIAAEAYNMIYAGYSRGEELESDRLGIVLADKVGYDPKGLGDFLKAITARNKSATEKQGLFASHPEMKERLDKLDKMIADQKLTSSVVLADRYRSFITYQPKAQTEITQVVAGSSGLAGGTAEEPKKDAAPAPKKRGFGLGSLLKPGGEEKKSAQVTGSGGSRGVDTERGAPGGGNPAIVVVALTPAEIEQFKKDGKLR